MCLNSSAVLFVAHGSHACALGGLKSVETYWELAASGGYVANKYQDKQGDILSYGAKSVEALIEQKNMCCMQILMHLVI